MLLIPVHRDGHWSLILVTHPAGIALAGGPVAAAAALGAMDSTHSAVVAAQASHMAGGRQPPPGLCPTNIVHFDSMGPDAGHPTGEVAAALGAFLLGEWLSRKHDRKSLPGAVMAALSSPPTAGMSPPPAVDWAACFVPVVCPPFGTTHAATAAADALAASTLGIPCHPLLSARVQDHANDGGVWVLGFASHCMNKVVTAAVATAGQPGARQAGRRRPGMQTTPLRREAIAALRSQLFVEFRGVLAAAEAARVEAASAAAVAKAACTSAPTEALPPASRAEKKTVLQVRADAAPVPM